MRLVDTPSQEVNALECMNKGVGRCELLKLTVGFQTATLDFSQSLTFMMLQRRKGEDSNQSLRCGLNLGDQGVCRYTKD